MGHHFAKPLIGRQYPASEGPRGGLGWSRLRRYSVGGSVRWHRPVLLACAAASLTATTAFGQETNYKSIEAVPDKPVQLSYHGSAHKNTCSPAPLPIIHVIEAPKAGVLTVRQAVLTTNKVARCPNLKIPAQVVFYVAGTGYAGPDHVKYEVTAENGEVADYDVTITVKPEPAPAPPAGKPRDQL
jgi:hypothetical protein